MKAENTKKRNEKPKTVKPRKRIKKPILHVEETLENVDFLISRNPYHAADQHKFIRMFNLRAGGVDSQLAEICSEIKLRTKITQQEIFFIVQLLFEAKQILIENKRNFKDWVEENFDFGYHTALNFCNVYNACFGLLPLIQFVKPSVLYRISSKQFPKELRNFLIFNNLLEKLNSGVLNQIYQKYKKNGFDAVKADLEESGNVMIFSEHVVSLFDSLTITSHYLESELFKLEDRLWHREDITWRKGATKNGDDIFFIISEAFKQCREVLSNADKISHEIHQEYLKQMREMYAKKIMSPVFSNEEEKKSNNIDV